MSLKDYGDITYTGYELDDIVNGFGYTQKPDGTGINGIFLSIGREPARLQIKGDINSQIIKARNINFGNYSHNWRDL